METQVAEFRKAMLEAMELLEDQVAKGNEKFVERSMASNQINRMLVEEVRHHRSMRSVPRALGIPASKPFYQPITLIHSCWQYHRVVAKISEGDDPAHFGIALALGESLSATWTGRG
ncbi:hypothetical protein BJX63DRAFT_89756 [Aspergillus granulosus]|uniref:Uncharacterized protein n=1 Tax=Aspergillus granulosus TaxID=176169 RepID=A0ABR4GVC5_9EURO